MNLTVVTSFFSPVEYELPKKHFLATMEMLRKEQEKHEFEVVVSQVIAPWQKLLPVPSSFFSDYYMTDHILFYKDNLWNLATTRSENTNFIFFDADVFFSNEDWVENVMQSLEQNEIIQPFETCDWLSKNGTSVEVSKKSAAVNLSQGQPLNCKECHVGFGWGCTRNGWNKIGGWFDANVSGSNDTATALAFEQHQKKSWTRRWFEMIGDASPAWVAYRENVQRQNISVGYSKGNNLLHRWHGENKNRQYTSRHNLFPRNENGNHPVHKNEHGLWQWDSKELNEGPKKYFERRLDDG